MAGRAEEVFPNERGGYLWTTVPLVFRLLGEWLKNTFGAE